jgi:hypothetical protein
MLLARLVVGTDDECSGWSEVGYSMFKPISTEDDGCA